MNYNQKYLKYKFKYESLKKIIDNRMRLKEYKQKGGFTTNETVKILNGEYKKTKSFFEDTKAANIDYCILNGKNFVYLAGLKLPAIYLVNNSVVENWVDYIHLDQSEIEKWLAKP